MNNTNDNTLNINKTIQCNSGSVMMLSFVPNINYQPQTATKNSNGTMSIYLDNRYLSSVDVATMFFILNELSCLEFYTYVYSLFMIKGLINIAKLRKFSIGAK